MCLDMPARVWLEADLRMEEIEQWQHILILSAA